MPDKMHDRQTNCDPSIFQAQTDMGTTQREESSVSAAPPRPEQCKRIQKKQGLSLDFALPRVSMAADQSVQSL